jgi:ribose transport system ATP-binding protein
MSAVPLLECQGVGKSFAGVRVLRDVNFALRAGRTVGLVGENGAGKSTLMNILGGNLRSDAGAIYLDGRPYSPRDPTEATRQGVAFIHQELNLFSNLSIAENIFLTAFPTVPGLPLIRRSRLRQRTVELLAQVGLERPSETPVARLSAGERQLVEIAKALSLDARLLILDEPTTSLSTRETEFLFALLGRLRARGLAMIYISHTLSDVLRLCDDILVMRDGEVVEAGSRAEFTLDRLITLMVGRSLTQLFPARTGGARNTVVLEAKRLSQPGIVHKISFALHRGEVLGLAGLMGAGRSELARILFGLDPSAEGEISLNGSPLGGISTRQRIRRGMALLTENRREEGLCMEAAIADNLTLVSLADHTRSPARFLDFGKLQEAVATIRRAVGLTVTARDEQPVKTLSGGNQQKVVLAKWLLAKPSVLILDEPTRGIDVGAKAEVYRLITDLAGEGAAILVISSELEELMGLCDRILVMRRGTITDELTRAEFDQERILRAALGEGQVEANPGRAEKGSGGE